jgi:membrane protein insertase Oxa1/YidC/SpoIIIJ
MKKIGLILTTLGLFAFSVYLAFVQGSSPLVVQRGNLAAMLSGQSTSPLFGGGLKSFVARLFSMIMNAFLNVTGHSVIWALILLALAVELVLLYPSVRLQLKQKKIHWFHKKIVDRFSRGELSVSSTREELHKVYDVNERLHRRGAWLVVAQVLVFFFTFWGLSLMIRVPGMLAGSWSVSNFSLLMNTESIWVPLLASLIYFFHAIVKIYYKEKEDYLSPTQNVLGILFAILGATVVYYFASLFAIALTVYFITLVTFATIRFIVVEQHAQEWGKLAQHQMLQMLRDSKPEHDRFEYLSRRWNHLPVVRHINFALMEEALSMTLGLMLALSFFGGFQKTDKFYAAERAPDSAVTVGLHQVP